jgi:hypothetical protein
MYILNVLCTTYVIVITYCLFSSITIHCSYTIAILIRTLLVATFFHTAGAVYSSSTAVPLWLVLYIIYYIPYTYTYIHHTYIYVRI